MSIAIEYLANRASVAEIAEHLLCCDADFLPTLSARVEIRDYAQKIANKATRFEAWSTGTLVALVAAYCNDQETHIAHITSVSVLKAWTGRGIAASLINLCIENAKEAGMRQISLEVATTNIPAIKLYEKSGFMAGKLNEPIISMTLNLNSGETMNNKRDYNVEIADTNDHKYAYGFDFDVMHPYMIKSFEPLFNKGSLLELGSFKGDFTRRFLPYFDDVTCVEASEVAVAQAQQKLGDKVTFVNSLFEKATLPKRYNNVVLTHVLEHLDDPVLVLKRINDEWLAEGGRFFLVCPNANAPSRQIAVKMGLITHNSAVTPAEAEHGHRCTYTLDTLERDAVAAGLKVVHRSGIFFKALANFQWDRLLQTDVISKDYLEGCYKLGQHYPDLCSSIFLMCEQGEKK
ncbi:MAG: GNAT family N-acetyltransferase [Rhodoferax sp.]|uniref:GNAT family N-acetyltransferase n=1 Tax=Rhodoferax sp. TaxID=50421 RepID=UPI00271969F0|nr:GNAT family N-acetyltransferase [Rhodoferax sp.]MDO8448285.1 GNAT family N-acetyltransferase [Rhodoferax sp.]